MTSGPTSIGIIMDGNRRWAKERNLPTFEGHRAGLDTARKIVQCASEEGVSEITLYALSTENWKRAKEEVSYLLKLIEFTFEYWLDEFVAQGGRVRFIGERTQLPGSVISKMEVAELRSKNGTRGTLVIALSYGGRAEIVSAVNALLSEEREHITEEEFRGAMWSKELRDPDLIIRTGGDMRLSNFLTWQSVYSELMFTPTLWPAYSEQEFRGHLKEYQDRRRNFGV